MMRVFCLSFRIKAFVMDFYQYVERDDSSEKFRPSYFVTGTTFRKPYRHRRSSSKRCNGTLPIWILTCSYIPSLTWLLGSGMIYTPS